MKRILYTLLGMMLSVGVWAQTTLQEQINSAEAGTTVTLSDNVTLEARIDINKNITVDLGNHTITTTATCGNGSAFNIVSGTVTIQNGTIDASFGEAPHNNETDAITARSGSDVTLKDLNITVNSKNGACAYAFEGSKITIKSGHYENQTTETYQYNANIKAMVVNQANVATQLIFIEGGTFKGYDPTLGDDSQTANENATFLAEGVALQKDASGNYTTTTAVAKIGGKNYASLADAIAAVPTDGTETTIKMLADVDLPTYLTIATSKNVVLDLNGKTIKNDSSKSLTQLITANGKLTINDSSEPSTGEIKNTASGKVAIKIGSYANSVTTLNNGTISVPNGSSDGVINGTTGTFVMNGGVITAVGKGVKCGNVTINGGTITSSNDFAVITAATSNTTITINGGTITGSASKGAVGVDGGNVIVTEGANINSKITFTSSANGLILPGTAEKHIDNATANLEVYDGESLLGYATAFTTGYVGLAGQTVKLHSNIASNGILKIRASKLDLNGHSLSTTAAAAIVTDGRNSSNMSNLTITGDGNVSSSNVSGCNAVQVGNYANVTIDGGNFSVPGDNSTIYISSSIASCPTTIYITGGSFESGDSKWILNIKDDAIAKNAKIVVTGGQFKNFDPANSTVDGNSDGNGTNYVPEDYVTTFTMDGSDKIYTVKAGQWIAKIEGGVDSKFRFATLDDAITAANGAGKDVTITLLANATAMVEPTSNVTIDADGKALTLPSFNVADGAEPSYAKVTNATDNTYKVTTATYNRTGAAGTQWGTACLPFSFETAPAGYTLYTPTTVGDNALTVTEVTYPVAAGTPVIFYKGSAAETTMIMTSSNASVKIDAAPVAQSGSLALVGTFSQQNITEELSSIYYINGDKFHQAKASLTVPAYRAYIKNTSAGAKPRVLSIVVDEDATAIESLDANAEIVAIYDASGRQLTAPKKGLNIMKLSNGKTAKLFVK